jgi:serine/threonine-protein kinase
MAEIIFTCVKCGTEIEADENAGGGVAACPNCNATVVVPMPGIKAGMRIAGYRVERRLGMGGMGEVWLATQTAMKRKVALKILSPALTSDAEFVERFLKEVELAAKLEHQNIVTAFDAGVEGRIHYLVMSYVDGDLLDDLLTIDKQIPERKALGIARGVAEGLRYAWEEYHILHRDIKPANIMLDGRGTPKLMDMGISKSLSEDKSLTMTGMIIGTPYYMSPEQARADADVDYRSDIYALGATLYHLVTSAVPYDATTAMGILTKHITEAFPPPQQKNPEISDACAVLLEVMMAKKPENRPKDWAAAIADIDLVLAGQFPRTTRPSAGASLVMQKTNSQALSRRKIIKAPPKAKLAPREKTAAQPKPTATAAPAGARKSTLPLVVGAVAAVLVLALVIGGLLMRGGKPPAATPLPPSEVAEPPPAEPVPPVESEAERQARLVAEAKAVEQRQQEMGDIAAKFAEQALAQGGNLDVAIANLEKVKEIGAGTQYAIKANVEIAKLTAARRKLEDERRQAEEAKRLAIEAAAQKAHAEQEAAKRREQLLRDCAGLVMAGDFRTAAGRVDASGLSQELTAMAAALGALADEDASIVGTFQGDLNREIEIELASGAKEKIKPLEIRGGILVAEVRVGAGTMRRQHAPAALSEAERMRRLAAVDRGAAAMKLVADAVKADNHAAAQRYTGHCGELADILAAAVADAQAEAGLSATERKARTELLAILLKVGVRTKQPDAEATRKVVAKCTFTEAQEQELVGLVEKYRSEYGESKYAQEFDPALAAMLETVEEIRARDFTRPRTVPDLALELLQVPAGSFKRDSGTVRISRPCWLGKHEVTQAQWQAIMGSNPSQFKGNDLPVERVSWDDCVTFCEKLTERERAAGRLPEGYVYRLPTEAEWEHAARGGSKSQGYEYSGSNNLDEVAWHKDNSGGKTQPVGQKKPNELGFHDMSGNAWEWCHDWRGDYPAGEVTDPRGAQSGPDRVRRGGGWSTYAGNCRSAVRYYATPSNTNGNLGFRVSLAPPVPAVAP